MDIVRLRESFGRVAIHRDELPLFLCSYPFIKQPAVGDLFPDSMAAHRGDIAAALVKIGWSEP